MIRTKKEYLEYLGADKRSNGFSEKHLPCFKSQTQHWIWQYLILLRKCEYYQAKGDLFSKGLYGFYKIRWVWAGRKLGYEIPLNVCGKGLRLLHGGPIIINDKTRIGDFCTIHSGVNMGEKLGKAPNIGNYVYLSPGAKLFGPIYIADHIAVGANAVVNKSFGEEGISIAGVPARKVSDNGWMKE